ncbi:protein Niban 1 [Ochotona curzoniae]|uniref:protein Niban 1 n=1 Tax=Ochotona curzoniae TaxID=130825 RepID=UPI001B350F89|nr:protein Niban 1 [Ochotona curzoniae]
MGGTASSQLDETRSAYIRGKTEAVLKNFGPYYSRQYAVAFCSHVHCQVEQHRDTVTQLLKTKPALEPGTVLYEAEVMQFAEDLKKWKERYIVIKDDFAMESYESREAYQKGAVPKSRVLPVDGKVFTSEAEYSLLADRHFPDPTASSEDSSQLLAAPPREFPVFLWQPFLRHGYFCFAEATAQRRFSATLRDCIRRLNHDYRKQTAFEARAFLAAVQFFRQEKGHYGAQEVITGDEVQVLSSLVMEELLPALQADLLPTMKGKRNDKKRAWFGLLEEAFLLVQRQVAEGLRALKEECQALTEGLDGKIRADMDQIINSKNFLAGKLEAMLAQPAEEICARSVRPFLASVLDELLGPVSSGFREVRSLFEKEVDELGQSFQTSANSSQLQEHLDHLLHLPLDPVKMELCYSEASLLQEGLQDLSSRFCFSHVDLLVQRTQNHMQELMENAVFTFTQLLAPHLQGEPARTSAAIEKVKLRVLKQYDHDSSSVRKKLLQEALLQIALPTVQKALAPTCRPELHKYEQLIFADHSCMIQVESVYEEVLQQFLLGEVLRVIGEAAVLKKHNLFEQGVALPSESVSSLTDLKTPVGSNQASPVRRASATPQEVPGSEGPDQGAGSQAKEEVQPGPPAPGGDRQEAPAAAEAGAGSGSTGHPQDLEPSLRPPESTSGSLQELRKLLVESVQMADRDPEEEASYSPGNQEEENATEHTAHHQATAPDLLPGPQCWETPEAPPEPQPGPGVLTHSPPEQELIARASPQDAHEGTEALGAESQGTPAVGSMGPEEAKAAGAHACQWVVDVDPTPTDDAGEREGGQESSAGQPSH